MHDTAIELLIIGNNQSEVEGYLTALRNSGIAVHANQIHHDSKAVTSALQDPIHLILYTIESGEIGLSKLLKTIGSQGAKIPVVALDEACHSQARHHVMTEGACDLVERKESQLLVSVIKRELEHVRNMRDLAVIENKLTETEERCNLLTESSRDAIAYIHQGMHIRANSTYLQLFGLAQQEDIEGLPILDMIAPGEHVRFKQVLRKLITAEDEEAEIATTCLRSDGTEFPAELSFLPAVIEGEPCTQVIIRNKSPNREIEEKLRILSTRDTHTGLYNRQYFLNTLEEYCKVAEQTDNEHVLFYITLDNFKEIRDSGGMLAADSIISELALQLRQIIAEEDILARFGDHTFTLLTEHKERASIISMAEKICTLTKDHDYQDNHLLSQPTCSIGIAHYSPHMECANDFINQAYQAWDQASSDGVNQFRLAADTTVTAETCQNGDETDLERLICYALEHGQFRLVYQPVVSLHGDTRENYAVLVRLLDNNQREIHPDRFFAQVEALGKMPELDRWVIRQGIAELTKQRQLGHKINFLINISGPSLDDEMLLLWICDCLREFEAKGSWLVFQIKDSDTRSRMQQLYKLLEGLKKIKCKISIDHFGLAPKPDAVLHKLPIDYVQFDQQLVQGLAGDQEKQDRLNVLNRMVQKAGSKTIAAGVDETNSLAILWSIGVNYIRGYFIQEPSPTINFDFKMESSIN
ncbi:MAG: EAL domain-containing protein [Chromatiales bacterium]|jgi:diguanylate cyclase (GGDEF)-like protein/PAS domain S-box-containing protein